MTTLTGFARAGLIGTLVIGLLFGGDTVTGFPRSHSPFFPEENYILPLNICNPVARTLENVHPALGSVTFTAPDGQTLILTMSSLREPYTERYYAQVIQGERIIVPTVQVPLVSTVVSLLPAEAICHDLNGDGITDFLTDHSRHGNGLGARFYDRLVILSSSAGGYRFWILQTMDPSPDDYVTFRPIENLAMVTTSFANSGGAIPHSYYVYDLWSFRDGAVVPANNVDPRFPKWIWMTLTENHKPARSLSQEEKQKILNPRRAEEIRISKLNKRRHRLRANVAPGNHRSGIITAMWVRLLIPLAVLLVAACSEPPMETMPGECVNALSEEELAQGCV